MQGLTLSTASLVVKLNETERAVWSDWCSGGSVLTWWSRDGPGAHFTPHCCWLCRARPGPSLTPHSRALSHKLWAPSRIRRHILPQTKQNPYKDQEWWSHRQTIHTVTEYWVLLMFRERLFYKTQKLMINDKSLCCTYISKQQRSSSRAGQVRFLESSRRTFMQKLWSHTIWHFFQLWFYFMTGR